MEDDTLRLFSDAEIEVLPPETRLAHPTKPPCASCGRPASTEEDYYGTMANATAGRLI